MYSQSSIIIITFLFNSLFTTSHLPASISALPIEPDPYPELPTVQTQILNRTLPTTIPAFPEQSQASACPLDLPESLFHDIKSACAPKNRPDPDFYSSQLHRSRCCPVLAAWLYSAYAETGLGLTTATTAAKAPSSQTTPFDMPDLPDDSETCVNNLEKALGDKGVFLQKPNETCDVVFCYCGIRLHPFSCTEAFRVNKREKLVGGETVKKLEKDCFNYGRGGGLGGCSKCLNSLYSLNADKSERSNTTDRTYKMHNQDCELMGLTWLLNKNRSAYIHTVSAVLRALMLNPDKDSDPAFCSLNSDGMPLAVDSSEINNQSSSTVFAIRFYHHLLPISSLFCTSIFFLVRSVLV
ncbi:uncharacterized GPI-anchored protein at4g28100 [Phtheirospermum japonicum]|uniref:Uncharacterized GPI-anchored protein at4g28100 n=1 Tax=Phtheirospermum japonicum TaxID=374723 RepID=A0A830BG45_9LAMI|nr:uncharacterized GPI-anchored protein at4g28100 [Phtheirospermum japonicum]